MNTCMYICTLENNVNDCQLLTNCRIAIICDRESNFAIELPIDY